MHARREARTDPSGDVVLLDDQDRTKWDYDAIHEGGDLTEQALMRKRPGQYQIQAAIAHLHCLASSPDATDWKQIAALYRELDRHSPSPVVKLNGAVAVALSGDIEMGLATIDNLRDDLSGLSPLSLGSGRSASANRPLLRSRIGVRRGDCPSRAMKQNGAFWRPDFPRSAARRVLSKWWLPESGNASLCLTC